MSLGSLIARARKDAHLSVEELSSATNLRATLIREIEKDDFSHCGGETYARGHVRTIALKLAADQKEFLRIFDEEQGTRKRTMKELLVENNVIRQPSEARKVSWGVLLGISLASLAIVAVAQIVISNISTNEVAKPEVSASPTPSQSAIPTQSPTPTPEPSVQNSFSTGTVVEVVVDAIRAKTWLFVSDAAGRTLFSGEIPKGSLRIFTSVSRLDLKVGNAGGVDLQVNGKKIGAIGSNGEVVSVSYGVDS